MPTKVQTAKISIPPVHSCIGVLYKVNGKGLPKVHNGKLLKVTKDSILVQHFTIEKVSTGKGKFKFIMKPDHFTFFLTPPKKPPAKWFLLLDVRRTPNFNPLFCNVKPSTNSIIGSGACIGVRFKTNGGQDVKNGKFLYAVDKNGNVSCTVKQTSNAASLPERIVYMHWNWSKLNAKSAVLVPETKSRSDLLEIRRNPNEFISK